jgi:hypothetical protein
MKHERIGHDMLSGKHGGGNHEMVWNMEAQAYEHEY